MNPKTVRVEITVRGAWEVTLSDRGERVTCETLEEASRVGYRCAADRRPCELIVCNAYHRVVRRELINGDERQGACLQRPTRRSTNAGGPIRRPLAPGQAERPMPSPGQFP
jgi:hypothetical protein